jgi:Protein of unknown function (DUF2778)
MRLIFAAVAGLVVGIALKLAGTHGIGPVIAGPQAGLPGISVFGTILPKAFNLQALFGPQLPDSPGVGVAGPEMATLSDAEDEDEDEEGPFEPSGSIAPRISFGERFSGAALSRGRNPTATMEPDEDTDNLRPLPPGPGERAAPPPRGHATPQLAPGTPLAAPARKRLRTADLTTDLSAPPAADSHTAIYDIGAHTVYLPDGHRLEAHSGLGGYMDDARYINAKGRGATPPNIYDLALRERSFHGVRAIRLIPEDDTKMFGRDGMLAHPYMLGPNGQSNGCVSFDDYPAFLNAFLRGDVERLVVVEHLASAPRSDTASGWIPEAIKDLFRRS